MPAITPIMVQLDRPRQIRWTKRAEARNSSLPRPADFDDLRRPRKRFGALTSLVWAALVDREHPFELPEDLAEHLGTPEQQVAAIRALGAMVSEAFPEKKAPAGGDDSAPSASGPGESSKSDSVPPCSTPGS